MVIGGRISGWWGPVPENPPSGTAKTKGQRSPICLGFRDIYDIYVAGIAIHFMLRDLGRFVVWEHFLDHFLFWIWQVWLWKARVGKFGKPHPVHAERCEWSKALVDWSESWLHMVNYWVMSPCVTSNTREPLKIPLQTSSCRGLCYLYLWALPLNNSYFSWLKWLRTPGASGHSGLLPATGAAGSAEGSTMACPMPSRNELQVGLTDSQMISAGCSSEQVNKDDRKVTLIAPMMIIS